ncbi:MAG: hypothetical protein U1E29_17515 [Coriobacteriia bacterium]|nr:hypothetical protein [Coriobacteriia bacterium]
MLGYSEHRDRFEIVDPMRSGVRLLLAAFSLIPLLAPYELLVRVKWESLLHPFFIFAALISAGAIAVSGLLLFAAVAGLSARMVFDLARGTVTYSTTAPVIRMRTSVFPLAAIGRIEVGAREWSDGEPTYHLRISMVGESVIEIGSARNRGAVEQIASSLDAFLASAVSDGADARQELPKSPHRPLQ